MAKSGTRPPKLDNDLAFTFWYNDGNRRTYGMVASHFKVAYNTVRNYASDNDWDGRAEELDRKAREIIDARLANLRAQASIRLAEVAMTVVTKFTQRLPEKVRDENGKLVDNPDLLKPGELRISDLLQAAKVLEMTGVIGQPDGEQENELLESLASLREEVAGMYERDVLDVEDGEFTEVVPPALPSAEEPAEK